MWEQTFQAYDEKQKNVAKFENTTVKQTTKSRFLDKENKSCAVLSNIDMFAEQLWNGSGNGATYFNYTLAAWV